jgi:hypothetical protein
MAINYFTANPDVAEAYQSNSYGLSPQEFADAHYTLYGQTEQRAAPVVLDLVSQGNLNPTQIAAATGIPVGQVVAQVASTVPQGQTITLGDTIIAPEYRIIGSGEDQQIGNLETIYTSKTTGDPNYRAPVGSEYQQYNADGTFQRTGTTQAVAGSFLEGLGEALTDPVVLAALAGGYGAGLFGGAGALGGAATVGATGLTAGEIAALTAGDLAIGGGALAGTAPLTAAQIAALTATDLAIGAGTPSAASTAGLLSPAVASGVAPAVAGMGTGTGLTVGGAGGLGGGATVAGLGTGVGTGLTTTGAGLGAAGTGAGITAGTGLTGTGVLTGSGLGSTLLGTTTGALTGTGVLTGSGLGTTLLGTGTGTGVTGALTTGVGTGTLGTGALTTGVGTGLGAGTTTGLGGLTTSQLGSLLSGALTTGSGILQQQTSAAAAQRAQQMIDAETTAAKQAAAFRPIGMTTRFGTSEFVRDPITGQLTSAKYTLSTEAKAQQDRLNTLAGAGLTQAEGAQEKFKPLQTGAESLFKLGAGYLAEKPEDVAKNYLASQLALLKPGRDLELANLQNRLQQQGRGGLSVAQGGTMGATTPELQALFNARAQQEAVLAANAQQAGQQQVLYGAGLLGQGTTAMGNYYAGQQAAYAPYTTALGQVTGLEALGQQPFTLGAQLGQTASTAGARVGQLGLQGAGQSVALATGPAATTNPYSTLLGGLGASPLFGTAAGSALTSLFG